MLHRLPESIVLDRGPQFAVELIKKLNRILGIKTKLLMFFYLQTDRQTEQINQKLKQYLWFFVDYRQKYWPEQLVLAEFVVNNKVYLITKVSPFIANYDNELKMVADSRRKGKVEKATKFSERMKKVQEEARVALRKAQEEMKQQPDRERKEIEEWKKGDNIILSIKDLVFKEQPAKKLVD